MAGEQLEHIGRGYGEIFGEGAGAIDTDPEGIAAQVPASGTAVAAMSAGDVSLARDPIAAL